MELKVVKVRNVFKPRWWQFRFRYRVWKTNREHERKIAQLTPEEREMYEDMERAVEHEFLFGNRSF